MIETNIMRTKTKKYCSGCETDLSVDGFHKDKSKKDGLYSQCKKCRSRRGREYYIANRDNIRPQQKEYRNANRGKVNQQKKKHYGENRDKINQLSKQYYATINGYLRHIFHGMKQRCSDPNSADYKNYGGRGIQNKFESSDEFVDYVINVLKIDPRGLQIDRINNDGNYEKGNIRFVTAKINVNNRRNSKRKVTVA